MFPQRRRIGKAKELVVRYSRCNLSMFVSTVSCSMYRSRLRSVSAVLGSSVCLVVDWIWRWRWRGEAGNDQLDMDCAWVQNVTRLAGSAWGCGVLRCDSGTTTALACCMACQQLLVSEASSYSRLQYLMLADAAVTHTLFDNSGKTSRLVPVAPNEV